MMRARGIETLEYRCRLEHASLCNKIEASRLPHGAHTKLAALVESPAHALLHLLKITDARVRALAQGLEGAVRYFWV